MTARALAERMLHPQKLDAWFLDSAQYTRELLFSSLFSLTRQVVCGNQKSVSAAYQSAKDQVSTSIVSVYNKLKGIDVETSAELVRFTAREPSTVIDELGRLAAPAAWVSMQVARWQLSRGERASHQGGATGTERRGLTGQIAGGTRRGVAPAYRRVFV